MSYIGKTPTIGNFQVCDAISVVNGQAAYTMQVNSVNVVPESANHMLVSLNGILQKPGGSFTVSGSTITFASNLATGDVIDFITLLGNVLDLGTPSDATVTNAKTNFVSTSSAAGLQIKGDGTTDGTLQLNCSQNSHGIKLKSPPHSASASYTLTFPNNDGNANQVLTTDGSGVLSFADAGGGAYNLLSTTNVTSGVSQVDFTSVFDGTYKNYLMTITNSHPYSDSQALRMRVFTSGGIQTGNNYKYATYGRRGNGSDLSGNDGGTDQVQLCPQTCGSLAYESQSFEILIYEPSGTAFHKDFQIRATGRNDSAQFVATSGGGTYTETTAITGLRFFFGSGNIDLGTFKLYGIS
tara:strand:+ start:62 stop:1120 length:1059 start_codon:yes stop_codon:yes gene_type:complete